METFSIKLRKIRTEHGMTQQELADLLYLDRTTILGYELRGKEPTFQTLIKIADIFDVSIDYLLGRDCK